MILASNEIVSTNKTIVSRKKWDTSIRKMGYIID